MPLLVRHRRGARLTAAGELLVQRTRAVEEILRNAGLELLQFLDMSGGQLRIGSFTRERAPARLSFPKDGGPQ